jgi:hypothetical protein
MADARGLHNPKQGMSEESFPLTRIDQVVDLTVGCELLNFLDASPGYL